MTDCPDQPLRRPADDYVPTEALIRRLGARPIDSAAGLELPDPFESDDEHAEFFTDLYASRRSRRQ